MSVLIVITLLKGMLYFYNTHVVLWRRHIVRLCDNVLNDHTEYTMPKDAPAVIL